MITLANVILLFFQWAEKTISPSRLKRILINTTKYKAESLIMKNPLSYSALRLQAQFEEIDKDKSGTISKKELKRALKKEGNLTEWEIIEFVNAADKDGDGQISLDEWLEVMLDDAEEKNTTRALVRFQIYRTRHCLKN